MGWYSMRSSKFGEVEVEEWMWLGLRLGIRARNCSWMVWYIMDWWMGRRLNRRNEGLVEEIEFPFEICALEVLKTICSLLDARTREFETPGYVALDELTSKVCDCYSHTVSWASGILLKLVDEQGHISQTRLRVQDVFVMTDSPTRILTQWNRNNQPVGDSSSLLAGFLGQVASNFGNFPVLYENWTQVPEQYKNNVYVNTIQLSVEENIQNHPPHIPHDHWAIFVRYRLTAKAMETIHSREFSRAEIYQLSHKKPDGTFVNEEASELHEKLHKEMQHCSENEAFLRVCGKEHPGYVRGMGLGVSPSQIIGSSSGATSSTTSFESNERIEQMQAEIQTLKAQVAEIDSFKAQVAEVDVLKQQISFLMQRAKGDETLDLESPVENVLLKEAICQMEEIHQ
ncbi:hypothetical protein Fmac_001362 [Flemingia macrophylla]|uniref:Aminotransferase-like plant mobile domain-containing protein n=1 Tax=Flemingia macrophylla TaxID=520843 RepID=A0ABD1NGW2_9FABA